MSIVIKYQVSLFVAFQPYTTAADCFKNAFELFFPRGFFPSTIQEQLPGLPMVDRLALVNNTLGINVQFLSNRIDFLAMPFSNPQSNLTLARFSEEVRAIIAIALAPHNMRVERLALITERMNDDLPSDKLDDVRKRFINSNIDGFDDAENIEWSARQVIRTPLSGEYDTVCNHIYSVGRGTFQFADTTGFRTLDALQVALDINTHSTPGLTFDIDGIHQFLSNVLVSHDALLGKIETLIHGN